MAARSSHRQESRCEILLLVSKSTAPSNPYSPHPPEAWCLFLPRCRATGGFLRFRCPVRRAWPCMPAIRFFTAWATMFPSCFFSARRGRCHVSWGNLAKTRKASSARRQSHATLAGSHTIWKEALDTAWHPTASGLRHTTGGGQTEGRRPPDPGHPCSWGWDGLDAFNATAREPRESPECPKTASQPMGGVGWRFRCGPQGRPGSNVEVKLSRNG
jgi:hypothetical protein